MTKSTSSDIGDVDFMAVRGNGALDHDIGEFDLVRPCLFRIWFSCCYQTE